MAEDDDLELLEEEKPEDLGDPKHVAARRKRASDTRREFLETLEGIMSSPPGRAFIYELLTWCHLGTSPFSTNALSMAHNCGELNIGNRLLADISVACMDKYTVMMKENING
jgi:hypothetical protein